MHDMSSIEWTPKSMSDILSDELESGMRETKRQFATMIVLSQLNVVLAFALIFCLSR